MSDLTVFPRNSPSFSWICPILVVVSVVSRYGVEVSEVYRCVRFDMVCHEFVVVCPVCREAELRGRDGCGE